MSLTTGEVIARMPEGMSVTPTFIESLGITPAEKVKGKAKWAEADLPTIRDRMVEALGKMNCSAAPVAKVAKPAAKKPVAPVDDDDDL